jgi:hypothetical protein
MSAKKNHKCCGNAKPNKDNMSKSQQLSAGCSTIWRSPFIAHHYVKLLLYPTSTERLDLLPVVVSQEP